MNIGLGWAHPPNTRKWHYFRDNKISLCGKWAVPFMSSADFIGEDGPSPEDCAVCRRKLNKMLAEKED